MPHGSLEFSLLVLAGLVVGAVGTLVGAGGGFALVPLLRIVYPDLPPATLTAMSLAVVCLNATSGSIAYARLKRIDYHAGALFSLAGVPGAILGAWAVNYVPIRAFDILFGATLLGLSGVMLFRAPPNEPHGNEAHAGPIRQKYNVPLGIVISVAVGFMSSLLGIGGGIIHVPAMIHLLHFPVHIAAGTSHFVLAFMTFSGTAAHVVDGAFSQGVRRTAALGIGAVIGAQGGARMAGRVGGKTIARILAVMLGAVALRLLSMGLFSAAG